MNMEQSYNASSLSGRDLVAFAREVGRELANALTNANAEHSWRDDSESYQFVETSLSRAMERLSQLNVWGPDNRLPSSAFWDESGDLLRDGDLILHARFKPRGYAGDFEMLDKICYERLCDHPLGRLLDRFFQMQHAPQAVRNRTRMVSQQIVEGCRSRLGKTFHVVSIGSGPAIDVQWALEQLDEAERQRLLVTLIDLDPHALEHAERRLQPLIPSNNLTVTRQNLYRLWRNDDVPGSRTKADFVFCTGVFDYLNDEDAIRLLHTLATWVGEGRLLVFNFSPANPTRAFMEWIGNWYLTYRTEGDMRELAERANLPAERTRFGVDDSGVNLFIEVRDR
jgi:extracellular factor (EF) 3-hydroxypalmitic acid methyl ester biosynthesis protein